MAHCSHCLNFGHDVENCDNLKKGYPKVDPYDFTTYPKYIDLLKAWDAHIQKAGFEEIVEPIDDQLVIRRFPDEEATAGGILIAGKGEKQHRGVVLFAGPGKLLPDHTLEPMRVGVGDIVIFGFYAGVNAIRLNGEGLIVLRQPEITGMYRRKSLEVGDATDVVG